MSKLNSLKFIYLVVATLALTTSCSKDRNLDSGPQKEITFGNLSTRATVGSADDILQFGVFAQMNLGADGTDEATDWISLLANEEVSRANASSSWTYDNKRYWINDRTFRFFAYWPYLGENKDAAEDGLWQVEEIADASGNCSYELSFVTPDTADEDLVISHKTVPVLNNNPPTSVDLEFNHQLTKIFFKVNYDGAGNKDDAFKLKELTISNIKKSGTLSTSRYDDYTDSWSVDNTQNITFKWSPDTPIDVLPHNSESGVTSTSLWEEGLRLIPQTVAVGAVGLYIKYQYDDNRQGNFVDKEIITTLPAITWQIGLQYTYVITLHEDEYITFKQIDIEPWGSPQQGGVIIIK